jgi:diaminopimelate decarboxylase
MQSQIDEGWHGTSLAELHTLAERYRTPYFLYNADEIARRIGVVRQSLMGLVEIYYAVKANPNLQLLRFLKNIADWRDSRWRRSASLVRRRLRVS